MGTEAFPEIVVHRRTNAALELFNADRLRWLDKAAAAAPIACLRLGLARIWVVTDPDVARTMLTANSADWARALSAQVPIRVAVGENLFTASDEVWATIQPSLSPAFRGRALAPRLDSLGAVLDAEVAALPLDTAIDLELMTRRITLIAAAWVLLGERLDRAIADELAVHEGAVIDWVGHRAGALTSALPVAVGADARRMRGHAAALAAYAAEVIARRRAVGSLDGGDVLDALLAARPRGRPLAERDLVSHVLGLFLAGNETTASALSWALVHAAARPTEWAATATDPVEAGHYLTETLRLTPAVWGMAHVPTRRGVTMPTPHGPLALRRTDAVTTYMRGINHDPTRWPEPGRFLPSRHADATAAQRQSLLTFGLGPRSCIGQHLAVAEMTALIPRMSRAFDVTIDQPIEYDAAFSLRVRGGLTGTLRRRTVAA